MWGEARRPCWRLALHALLSEVVCPANIRGRPAPAPQPCRPGGAHSTCYWDSADSRPPWLDAAQSLPATGLRSCQLGWAAGAGMSQQRGRGVSPSRGSETPEGGAVGGQDLAGSGPRTQRQGQGPPWSISGQVLCHSRRGRQEDSQGGLGSEALGTGDIRAAARAAALRAGAGLSGSVCVCALALLLHHGLCPHSRVPQSPAGLVAGHRGHRCQD